MNLRKLHGPLQPKQSKALRHAWHQAAKDGYPLNALISIRPEGNLTPLEYAELVAKTWNYLGVWSRRNTKQNTFHCILTRETIDKFGRPLDNFHALIHVERAKLSLLRYALTLRFPQPGEVEVKRANQNVTFNRIGKIESAVGYITKEQTGQAAWPHWQYRRGGGDVLGKRYRISANLRARPIELASDHKVTPRFSTVRGR